LLTRKAGVKRIDGAARHRVPGKSRRDDGNSPGSDLLPNEARRVGRI